MELRPLHTEGQGMPGGPKEYSKIAVCIPFGAYYKFVYKKIWSLGGEICFRKTFTDYIDDVGNVYYDNNAIKAKYGDIAALIADPYLGDNPGVHKPATDGTPAKRGNKQKDTYMTLEITLAYTLKKSKKSARLRSKF